MGASPLAGWLVTTNKTSSQLNFFINGKSVIEETFALIKPRKQSSPAEYLPRPRPPTRPAAVFPNVLLLAAATAAGADFSRVARDCSSSASIEAVRSAPDVANTSLARVRCACSLIPPSAAAGVVTRRLRTCRARDADIAAFDASFMLEPLLDCFRQRKL